MPALPANRLPQPMITPRAVRVGITLLSLAFVLLHAGPLNGSLLALILTVGLQVIWPGYLLTRALGLLRRGLHPLIGLARMLTGGLGLTIVLGGLARLLHVPVSAYELILHGLLIGLALVPLRPADSDETPPSWRFERRLIPWLVLLIVVCAVSAAGAYERTRVRFSGFEDQTVFVSLANWLAHDPSDPGLLSLRVGREQGDIRWATDGWTYTQAAWAWSSGRPPADIIWHDVTPLFAWLIPLIWFALAYTLTGRERAAVLTAAAVVILGLLTIDDLSYFPGGGVFGQDALFELGTLRKFSSGVTLPLALFTLAMVLKTTDWRRLLPMGLIGVALAMLHPQQVTMFLVDAGTITLLWWLSAPTRARLGRAAAIAAVLGGVMILPLVQWKLDPIRKVSTTAQVNADFVAPPADSAGEDENPPDAPTGPRVERITTSTGTRLLALDGLPLLGSTYVIDPALIVYHPLVGLAALLGLLAGVAWRRSATANFLFAATAGPLVAVFMPGIAPLFARFATLSTAERMMIAVPAAAILGISLDGLLARLPTELDRRGLNALTSLLLIGAIGLLYLEPLPLFPASGRDQIRAATEIEALRAMHPADAAMVARLAAVVPADRDSIVMMNARTSSYVIESVPHTLITGGRESGNLTYPSTARFFDETSPAAPWLDAEDVAFIGETGVTHLVLRADDTRLAQLQLQPERFPLLDAVDGYLIFGVGDLAPQAADALFAEMNAIYAGLDAPRWGPEGFALVRAADPGPWEALAAQWEARLAEAPADDSARLGLAFTRLLMGQDAEALPLWEQLQAAHPGITVFSTALAATQVRLGDVIAGRDTLLAQLDAPEPGPRLLAAQMLLSADIVHLLDDAQLDRVLEVAAAAPDAWYLLAELDRWDEVRQRAALLIGRERLDAATAALNALPIPEQEPADLDTLALIRLMQADPAGALDVLLPATDPDRLASRRSVHADRWQDNRAAQLYFVLEGNLAERDGDLPAAIEAYRRAIEAGSVWAGRAFLADALDATGPTEEAADLRAELQAEWVAAFAAPLPALTSLLDLDAGHPYASHLAASVDDATATLTLTFDAASHPGAYAVREWRIVAASPDAVTQYAEERLPAVWVEGALTRASMTLGLPDDLPELTPVRVFVQPQYANQVTYPSASADVVVQPPASATIPPDAVELDVNFEGGIGLRAATVRRAADQVTLTLYWSAEAAVSRDYQVFVHALDAAGNSLVQADSAPLDGRYPTGQWRTGTVIADPHVLTLPEGADLASLYVGLYTLPEGVRLPVNSAPPDVANVDNGIVIPATTP